MKRPLGACVTRSPCADVAPACAADNEGAVVDRDAAICTTRNPALPRRVFFAAGRSRVVTRSFSQRHSVVS